MASCATAPSDPDMLGGREVYASCVGCHGTDGAGGVGPALAEVRTTFGECADHIRWIRLGSERWKAEVGPTYGSQNTVIDKVMPSFDGLDDQAIRQVAMYERIRFGGGDTESERAACGLG